MGEETVTTGYTYQGGPSPAVVPAPAPAATPIEDQTTPGSNFSFEQRLDYLERKLGLHVRDEQPQPESSTPALSGDEIAQFQAWKAAQGGAV